VRSIHIMGVRYLDLRIAIEATNATPFAFDTLGGKRMKLRKLSVVALLAACVAGCGGNSTPVGVTITPATATVIVRGSQVFSAVGTGSTTNTVNWQICLPPATSGTQPTNCTPLPGQTGTGPTGVGTITQASSTQAGGLYTAPSTVPQTNPILVVATSTVSAKAFAAATVTIDSGVRVQITPLRATIAPQERFLFVATVTGTANQAVTWSVNGVAGGDSIHGFVCPNSDPSIVQPCPAGTYIAPSTPPGGAVTVTATSAADSTKSASAAVTVTAASGAPTIASIDPSTALQGSVQQDVYINGADTNGSDFSSTSTVLVDGVPIVPVFLSDTLLRVTIPSQLLQQAKPVNIQVQRSNGDSSAPAELNIVPVRPGVISSLPDSVSQTTGGVNVSLTGGLFFNAPGGSTSAIFNGQTVTTSATSSRQLSVTIPPGALSAPGLYPILVQNPGIPANLSSVSALNLAVTPNPPSTIPTAPIATLPVGASPSAIAIDPVLNLAAVANTADGSVSLISLTTNSVIKTIPNVGNAPSGIAIDDQLPDHIALVVNSGDNTVSTVDLTTQALVGTPLSVQIGAPPPPVGGPVPIAIAVNSLTHRAIVAYQSTNLATVLDVSTGVPVFVQQIGGSLTGYSTGVNPAIAIDPRLNWAVVTPGGGGAVNIVDLGRAATSGDGGRAPQVIGTLSITTSIQGVGINTETHQVLLSDPTGTALTTFSLLDEAVNSITFTVGQQGYVAAGVNSLSNVGIAVNSESSTAAVVDLENGVVLQPSVSGLGTLPQAVAVDAVLNEALVVNQGSGAVSILSLGNTFRNLQIAEASPDVTFAPAATNLTLTINGIGFVQGTSQVFLDRTGLPAGNVAVTNGGRQIIATIPASMLTLARRYTITVQNSATNVSNATDLAVVQPVVVGNSPSSVAVDTDTDVAVVTNSADGTVSLIDLTTGTTLPQSPLSVGTGPVGVTVLPRLALLVVANNGSSDVTVLDENGINPPQRVDLCGGCTGPTGVAVNQDTAEGVVAASGPDVSCATTSSGCEASFLSVATTGSAAGNSVLVNQNPVSAAIDPNGDGFAAVGTASQAGSLDVIDLLTSTVTCRQNGIQVPSGVVFDPVNQVFVVANSLQNNLVIVDPVTCIPTTVRVGINPTSLDYDFQTSTLVTVNSASNTMSFLDYVCPPVPGPVGCPAPQTRAIFGLPSSGQFSQTQQFSVAIDAKLDIAVVVDTNNSRVLLVPIPH
jgi:YVTN family beta-propeller protein